tara:strand:- start:125 stop:1063 length:939 start_codon:yes stop_codon:yes gene_type:complete
MFELVLDFISEYLISVMTLLFFSALGIRYIIFMSSKHDLTYFSTFAKEIERILTQSELGAGRHLGAVNYLTDLFDKVSSRLPSRSLRSGKSYRDQSDPQVVTPMADGEKSRSLREYLTSSDSILTAFRSESNALASPHRPNFYELTRRILSRDPLWNKVLRVVPIDSMARFLDILPGIFIVLGIFGTFIGITLALPQIATMDLSRMEMSDSVLSLFIEDIAFAMRSSIAGIFFSMLLNGMNALSPINATREVIMEKVELCLENLWFFLQEHEEGEDIIQAQKEMIRLLGSIDGHLSNLQSSSDSEKTHKVVA